MGDNTVINENIDGADLLYGDAGNDTITGGVGDDTIDGGAGNDRIFGEAGNDYITGGDNDDYISGGANNDVLLGGAGDDTIIGGDGNDYLTDGEGTNRFEGGSGADTYFITYSTNPKTQTIVDSDGLGSINAGGFTLAGGTKQSEQDSVVDANGFTYSFSGVNLTITKQGYSILVQDFTNGNLGISLKDGNGNDWPPIPTNSGQIDNQIEGKYKTVIKYDSYGIPYEGYVLDANGNKIPLNENLVGTSGNDYINGNGITFRWDGNSGSKIKLKMCA